MDFSEAYNSLLDYAKRSSNETGLEAAAKREINAACLQANRNHEFKYAEAMAQVIYPANTQFVIFSDICNATIINLICVELLPESPTPPTVTYGIPLLIKQYQRIQSERLQKNDNAPVWFSEQLSDGPLRWWEEEYYNRVKRDFKFFVATISNGFGLWPLSQQNQNLQLLFNAQLPQLVNDDDTNFLLENCWDYILLKALKRFNMYLKEDNRVMVTEDEIQQEWASILEWDAKIRTLQY